MFNDPRRSHDPVDPKDVLSSIGEVVYTWDLPSDDLRWGPNASDILGDAQAGTLNKGLAFARLLEPGAGRSRYDAIMDASGADLGDGVPYRTRYAVLLGERKMWAEDTGRWFAGIDGTPVRARGVLRLERPVTDTDLGAPSYTICDRSALVQRLDELMADQMAADRSVVVLAAAIDDLTRINDDFGHEATDEILIAVQERLRGVMRTRDRLMRYSSNRFAIILTGCPVGQIETAARRFVRAVSKSAIETTRGVALARIRIGAAIAPDLTRHSGALLTAAEGALLDARRGSLEAVVVARSASPAVISETASMDLDALGALNERRIRMARQPIVRAGDRSLAFHEGLVRIERPDGSYFAPGDLLPMLERRGLVRLFDHRVLELSAAGLVQEPSAILSINVSPISLTDPVWLDAFRLLMRTHAGLSERMIVEVTETATISHAQESLRVIHAIKDCGCKVAIDDFGAGHTSLRHLREFPIDILKLDGAFTQNLARSTDDRFFVRTLLDLAQHLGVETVAEWVDTEAAARMLTDWGVTYLQGHLTGAAEIWAPGATSLVRAA
ncbi:MAG: bifunctional diguanylate cyclase/phosphodiesterase [Beijerinckiaceae bacterium]|jgi:diguanylate cyclase (GGDEF)-like protein|nr:bifunctional diguanylate cyclase/phosphodiesterase [Beijerinckiaceae bacterium]